MRSAAWILLVMGLAGVAACTLAVFKTKQAEAHLTQGTRMLATETRRLLDGIDGKLDGLGAQFDNLSSSPTPRAVRDKLQVIHATLDSAREAATAALGLLRAATEMRGLDEPVELRFPRLVSIAAALTTLTNSVRAQTRNLETWMLPSALLIASIGSVREGVAATREATVRVESNALTAAETTSLVLLAFLAWMAAGHLILAAIGQRRIRA